MSTPTSSRSATAAPCRRLALPLAAIIGSLAAAPPPADAEDDRQSESVPLLEQPEPSVSPGLLPDTPRLPAAGLAPGARSAAPPDRPSAAEHADHAPQDAPDFPEPRAARTTPAPDAEDETPTPAQPNHARDAYREYTIGEGETFSSIAREVFGDERQWVVIAQANPLVDPARLRVGQTVRVPDPLRYEADRQRQLDRVAAALQRHRGPSEADADDDDALTVTVAPGDTLSHIARRVYGRASAWRHIYEANRDQLQTPDDLQVGMKLHVPPDPGSLN